ncbi:MAG: hypothetical protein IJ458_03495 [Clostridia bacterium]|nr:hypothetical protein [Clostridia bacterium]
MKGKNKLILMFLSIIALVATSVGFALFNEADNIRYAKATSVEAFTAELEGGVIFSAERVYIAENEVDTQTALKYQGYDFKSIQTNKGTHYFGDYALRNQIGDDNSHKHIIADGQFVMVDDNARYSATTTSNETVNVKQGIMVTLGGYYNDGDGNYVTNGVNTGANISYISAQATLNGKPVENLPSARGYQNSIYEDFTQDFTWFIIPNESTEGHYEISFLYEADGQALRYDFDFYLLLHSKYEQKVEVGEGLEYTSNPTMNIVPTSNNNYNFFIGSSLNYPTLTFDYARYDLEYTHISGDVTTTVKFDYDESTQMITLSKKVYNDEEVDQYQIDTDKTNTIITLMFADHGKYTFKFNYIYNYQGENILIDKEQIPFDDMTLTIHGYQLKYSKTGFASADMTYLEIYKNNTMFILVNGFVNADDEKTGDNLGINYKLINNDNYITGTIANSKTASIINDEVITDIASDLNSKIDDDEIEYQQTDRGLWLTLNDDYYLTSKADDATIKESFYYYHPSKKITSRFVNGEENAKGEEGTFDNKTQFTKVTTFTKPGYYLVQVKYRYNKDDSGAEKEAGQYFAFQITATTPLLELYKTTKETWSTNLLKDKDYFDFYAHEYTNNNVYADWEETDVFESKVVGKLYYSEGQYASESALKAVANGVGSSTIKKVDYEKKTVITESGAYLLVLEVERSATKTYTYFTIDKEAISGLQVYEVATGTVDNRAIYSIKQDLDLNYVTHTSKGVIDTIFTIDWADKRSGAKISANYEFTPFVKTNQSIAGNSILIEQGSNTYKYIINEYSIGESSKEIEIHKPTSLNSALDINNILTDQGIYKFNLKDQAGNKLTYIVVVDRTEGVVNATYGDANQEGVKNPYISGQLVADYVELEWGTHKALNLGAEASENVIISKLLNNVEIDNYYAESGNNLFALRNMFQQQSGQNLFIVENNYTEIQLVPVLSNPNSYIITKNGTKQIKYANGVTVTGWDDKANAWFDNATNMGIKINVDKKAGHIYNFTMVGNNQVTAKSNTNFIVRITPDEALGEIYSSSSDDGYYNNLVRSNGVETEYNDDGSIKYETYYQEQASDDGVFVFEWVADDEKFKVIEVKYNYYQLMDQSALNMVTDKTQYPYYPYKYVSTNYILQTEKNDSDLIEITSKYSKTDRISEDGQTKKVNQSDPINLAYETYRKDDGTLTSKKVTQTGLYIITRTISIDGQTGEYSYAFFVDRNMIVGYSISDIKQKVVGQFIHVAMPNSKGEVYYDNFTKQGVNTLTQTVKVAGKDEKINVYLETNKLPTKIQVPSGKYVSGKYDTSGNEVDESNIVATSYKNLKLKLSVYFYDDYGVLGTKGEFFKLMDTITWDKDEYINLSFNNVNDGVITKFKNARIHTEDNSLSVPGVYVFVIEDTVGIKLEDFEVADVNSFVFGIKLTNQEPVADLYSYSEINEKSSEPIYARDDKVLYTNQQFVDFEIPVEELKSYDAQLDIASIEIRRSTNSSSGDVCWLKLKSSTGENGFVVDTSGIIKSIHNPNGKDYVEFIYDENNKLIKYIIHLDTGLEVVDNQIVSYKEYVYTININYVLSDPKYYQYISTSKDEKGNETSTRKQFYFSTYKVVIDRTPNSTNLDALMETQGNYFEGYHQWLAKQNRVEASENINKTFAYRSTETVKDYYGLANALYYQFASEDGSNLSNQAMYALNIDYDSKLNTQGLSSIYYRKLDFDDDAIVANSRMGLLPITETYFKTTEYYTFNESLTAYSFYSANSITYYRTIMEIDVTDESIYNNNCGVFYEIIEKDMAGNLTQYVVYFAPQTMEDVSITINGQLVGSNNSSDSNSTTTTLPTVTLKKGGGDSKTFIGISSVDAVSKIATEITSSARDTEGYYPYYGNINIYNSKRENIKTIYVNSTSQHAEYDAENHVYTKQGIESEIYNAIKGQGNYTIEYINVFGERFSAIVNNYTDYHNLNIGSLQAIQDYMGQWYITFDELTTEVDETTYWHVQEITISYTLGVRKEVTYNATLMENGQIELSLKNVKIGGIDIGATKVDEIDIDANELDRLNLQQNIQYLVTVTDVGLKEYVVPISTTKDYQLYILTVPDNHYARDGVYYTSNTVQLLYNTDLYKHEVFVKLNDNTSAEELNNGYYTSILQGNYNLLTLLPDTSTDPAGHIGSLRKFTISLTLKDVTTTQYTYDFEIYIDTRATNFVVENTRKESKMSSIKSTFKNGNDKDYQDYNIMDLINRNYYKELITETINIRWERFTSSYFSYNYELFEFVNGDECVDLLKGLSVNEYSISPKENTTGKYIFKVTIESKDGKWIASRVYGIYMSTTITGLYEVKDGEGNLYDHTSTTNLREIEIALGSSDSVKLDIAKAFKVYTVDNLNTLFNNFGYSTAVLMYIANTELTLHSNEDNAVYREYYTVESEYTKITFYYIHRSNYYTFAVTMEVYPTNKNQNILSTLTFTTEPNQTGESLLNSGVAKTIYNSNAQYYRLSFNSYNRNMSASNPLEKHNKIIVDIYYNNTFAKRIKGGDESTSPIEFKNSGSYKLEIKDEAGNIQYFNSNSLYQDFFTVVVMKKNDMLYTVNGEAPIQYAYYDSAVTLQINRYNEATGRNNYDINTIKLNAKLNSKNYTGYEHPSESATYIFKDYGTYLITMEADLLGTGNSKGEHVEARLVFTILNPNEARTALDFTSIYGYNIISIFSETKTTQKDVTDKFMDLLQDKSNVGETNVYNKLITYERLVDAFGTATQGKMKFKVLYEVENDDLLPSRRAEFSFTLNNETASITSSIKAGGKTTDAVILKFNAANIYDQIGDCNLVINDEVVLRIDENSLNQITEIKVDKVGNYYVQLMGDSGNIAHSFNFTIKEPLNVVSIILIVVVALIVAGLIGTFIWLRTRMKVR